MNNQNEKANKSGITELTLDQMDKVTGGTNNYERLLYALPTARNAAEQMQQSTVNDLMNREDEALPPR